MTVSHKGPPFERWVATRLSLWWTGGERDDVFWRSQGSGGRATNRRRRGRTTAGQYGDLCATDPSAQPFIDLFTVEMKRGYNRHTIADLTDSRTPHTGEFAEWLLKLRLTHLAAGSWAWLLITRRDGRLPMVFMPVHVPDTRWCLYPGPELSLVMEVEGIEFCVTGMRLEDFLANLTPERVVELHTHHKPRTA